MSGFRTRIDYSDNRQITQRQLTSTNLSGTTVFGGEFSDLPSGVDLDNITFTGNSSSTTFTYLKSNG